MDMIENKGWIILNGLAKGDEKGEFTYIGTRGSTVIDYVIANEECWEDLKLENEWIQITHH